MPAWLHSRAEHILSKNPSMPKSEAFGIATNQSHALDKTPKSYGTVEGRAIYKTPEDDVQTANPKKKTAFAERMMPGTERYYSDRMLAVLQGLPAKAFTPEGCELEKDASAGPSDPVLAAFLDELVQMKEAGVLGDAAEKVKRVFTTPIPGTPELPGVTGALEKLKSLGSGARTTRPSSSFKAFQAAQDAAGM